MCVNLGLGRSVLTVALGRGVLLTVGQGRGPL